MSPLAQAFKTVVERYSSFVLTTHVNPDGDGLGSELALCSLLLKLKKQVHIINHSETPVMYTWMDPGKAVCVYDAKRDDSIIAHSDVIFIVDTNQPDRLRSMEKAVTASPAPKVILDHHLDPHPFASTVIVDTEATSTGEIVFRLVDELYPQHFDAASAAALYTAIMTDTGSFRYPRTNAETYRIAARLIDLGADPTSTYANVYERWTQGRMRLLGHVLDSLKVTFEGRLAYVVCTQEALSETGTTVVDTDNFTTYPMSVDGVQVGLLFNELDDGMKISFRSKGSIPINDLAKEFGGNGHLNAAGARLTGVKLEDTIHRVLAQAEKYLR
jgi:phosphoesterase RecJ-like protein